MRKCSIVQCCARKYKKNPHLTLHRLPRNENLRKKWLELIGNDNLNPQHCEHLVCSLHFDPSCFNRTLNVVRLRDDALPLPCHSGQEIRVDKPPVSTETFTHLSNIQNAAPVKACYRILNIPDDSDQEEVQEAFLQLAKKYHPDSGSPQASIDKFVTIENAFRTLTKHLSGTNSKDVEKVVYDIRHTAPQHRQYLSYDGQGYGTPSQRQKQWQTARAQRAADNVMEHRLAKSVATEGILMQKGQGYPVKHDIKTKYGFDRLVEDLIQESMSKGEFDNLSGKGKPLKDQNNNPYVDFTTHKLNEVLINNGFTPEWIIMKREIETEIDLLRKEIEKERSVLGPHPLTDADRVKWDKIYNSNKDLAKSINLRINKYNLIVPLMSKQKFYVPFDDICEEILKSGPHSQECEESKLKKQNRDVVYHSNAGDDVLSLFSKLLTELFSFGRKKKNIEN